MSLEWLNFTTINWYHLPRDYFSYSSWEERDVPQHLMIDWAPFCTDGATERGCVEILLLLEGERLKRTKWLLLWKAVMVASWSWSTINPRANFTGWYYLDFAWWIVDVQNYSFSISDLGVTTTTKNEWKDLSWTCVYRNIAFDPRVPCLPYHLLQCLNGYFQSVAAMVCWIFVGAELIILSEGDGSTTADKMAPMSRIIEAVLIPCHAIKAPWVYKWCI